MSSIVTALKSSKTVAASSKETPCLIRFPWALSRFGPGNELEQVLLVLRGLGDRIVAAAPPHN
jgi:hypothetical protein